MAWLLGVAMMWFLAYKMELSTIASQLPQKILAIAGGITNPKYVTPARKKHTPADATQVTYGQHPIFYKNIGDAPGPESPRQQAQLRKAAEPP